MPGKCTTCWVQCCIHSGQPKASHRILVRYIRLHSPEEWPGSARGHSCRRKWPDLWYQGGVHRHVPSSTDSHAHGNAPIHSFDFESHTCCYQFLSLWYQELTSHHRAHRVVLKCLERHSSRYSHHWWPQLSMTVSGVAQHLHLVQLQLSIRTAQPC